MNNALGIDRDRLSVLTGGIILALALSRFLDLPVVPISVTVFGSPLGIELSADFAMLVITFGMMIAAVDSLLRSHPMTRAGEAQRSIMHWILPGLLALALAGWLGQTDELGLWAALLVLGSIAVPVALASEYSAFASPELKDSLLFWGQLLLIHLVAAVLFVRIYDSRSRFLLSGTALLLVSTLLAARVFWPLVRLPTTAFLYGGSVGLLLGEAVWLLNYWRMSSLRGGLLLLMLFYITVGIIQQFLSGTLRPRVVWEMSALSGLAIALIFLIAT